MAAALPADLSVEPPLSLRGSPGAGSSLLSNSGQLPFSGLEMSQMLGGQIFPFGHTKEVSGHQSSNDQGISGVGPSGGGWQPQHSSVDSYYGGPPPSGFTGQFINPGGAIAPPHMLVYTNPFAPVSQFGQLGFMSPTYLPSGKLLSRSLNHVQLVSSHHIFPWTRWCSEHGCIYDDYVLPRWLYSVLEYLFSFNIHSY